MRYCKVVQVTITALKPSRSCTTQLRFTVSHPNKAAEDSAACRFEGYPDFAGAIIHVAGRKSQRRRLVDAMIGQGGPVQD